MILSTLSISSRGFALDFPKRPRINGDVLLTGRFLNLVMLIESSNVVQISYESLEKESSFD